MSLKLVFVFGISHLINNSFGLNLPFQEFNFIKYEDSIFV